MRPGTASLDWDIEGSACRRLAPALRLVLVTLVLLATCGAHPFQADAAELKTAREQFLSGQYSNCIKLCRQALADNSYSEEWHELLVRSQFDLGQYEAAAASLSNALQRFSWSMSLRLLGRQIFPFTSQSNRGAEMVNDMERMIGNRVDFRYRDPASVVALGRGALLLGADPRKVLDNLFEEARKRNPDIREPYLAMGELALEKHDYSLAARNFAAGLKKFTGDPEMHFGLARAYQPSDRQQMLQHIEATLNGNSNHVAAMLLLVDHLIDGEEYDEAEGLIKRALRVNPHHPEAWAFRAVIAHLRNDSETEKNARTSALRFHSSNPRVDHLIGQNLSQKYRFAEGAACQRRALEMDPGFVPAKSQLAMDLLRLGEETDGWQLAEEAHKEDEYDVTLFNLVTLKDKLNGFTTLTNADFIVRMSTNEARIYGEEALTLLARAKSNLVAKYGITLARPTIVEIYPEQKDFGVRTFGMPDNPGFLGVCFGPVITANSPAAQVSHAANWHAVLWHEFMHVVTLQMTRNKMPRWLSEGISVYEELQANPAWGQRMNAQYRQMILDGELTPISELSSAFLAPKTPMHLQFAYFESALAIEFLVKQFGFGAVRNILNDLGRGVFINQSIAAHTAPIEKLDRDFASWVKAKALDLGPGLDWTRPTPPELRSTNWLAAKGTNFWALQKRVRDLLAQKQGDAARSLAETLVREYPQHTGADSSWLLLAQAHRQRGDTNAERSALESLAAIDGDAMDAFQRLIEIGRAQGDWNLVRLNAERALAVNPLVPEPHAALAEAAEALKSDALAIRENRILLLLDPADPAQIHFDLARLLHRSNRSAEAKRHVLYALEEAPRFRAAHALLREMQSAEQSRVLPAAAKAP